MDLKHWEDERRTRREIEADSRRRGRELDAIIRKAERPAQGDVDHPADFRATMQRYRAEAYEAGGRFEPKTGSVYPLKYPHLEITQHGDVFGSYAELRQLLSDQGWSGPRVTDIVHVEAHHLLSHHLMAPFGFQKEEGLSVAVYRDDHMQLLHGPLGILYELPNGVQFDIWHVVDGHVRAYETLGYPEWAEKARAYVRQHQDRILEAYTNGSLRGVGRHEILRAKSFLDTL